MAKRYTDTQKFNDKWYRGLSLLQKAIWEYLLSECNHAGILEKFDPDLISFKIGTQVSVDDIKSLGERIIFISDEILFIPKFIKFQYETLNPQNRVHASVLKELKKYNLKAPCMVLESPLQGSKDKDKNKDKDKDFSLKEDRVQGEGEKENPSQKPADPYENDYKNAFIAEYKKVFGQKPVLAPKHLFKLAELVQNTDFDFISSLPKVLCDLKNLRFNWRDGTSFVPSASWLLSEDNFIKMLNDEFSGMLGNKKLSKAEISQIFAKRKVGANDT